MVRLQRAVGGAAAVAGRGGDDPVHSHRSARRLAERADALRDRVRFLHAWVLRRIRLPADAADGLLDDGTVPNVPDGGAGVPVRAEQHAVLFDAAAVAECRCGGALFDVPQHLRLRRDCGHHGARTAAGTGAPRLSYGSSDTLRPRLPVAVVAPYAGAH